MRRGIACGIRVRQPDSNFPVVEFSVAVDDRRLASAANPPNRLDREAGAPNRTLTRA
jgi:hypothetical protein